MSGGGPVGNDKAQTHGIRAFEENVNRGLQPAEVESLAELRNLVKTGDGREEVREEIASRLVIMCRKFFMDVSKRQDDPMFWDSGVVSRGGTYLAELRRWLDTFPPDKNIDALDPDYLKQFRQPEVNDDSIERS